MPSLCRSVCVPVELAVPLSNKSCFSMLLVNLQLFWERWR
jgi:hypothetical protein